MTTEGLSPDDYASALLTIDGSGLGYFVEGGQAVNIWAQAYSSEAPNVRAHLPFTSNDCDLCVSKDLLNRFEQILDGELAKASDPSQGQLGIFKTHDDPPKIIDLFDTVYGLT